MGQNFEADFFNLPLLFSSDNIFHSESDKAYRARLPAGRDTEAIATH